MSQGTEVIESHDLQVSLDAFNKARQALHSHPPGDLDRAAFLTDLGDSLRTRFDQLGDLNSLGEAVELFREALSLRLPGHRDRSLSLERLAITLQARFEQMGDLNSLSETIELHRQAQELRPPGHPDRHHTLNNLAISLQTRFEQLGNLDSLAEAVDLHRQALDLRPPVHPDRSLSLNNLANALKTRFEQLGNLESLAEAVDLYREALDLRPQGHPLRISSLRTLASALVVQSRGLSHVKNDPEATSPTQRCVSDLDEALSLYTEGLSSCTGGHPERINFLFDIGVCLVRPGTHLYNFEAGIRYLLEALRDPASSAQKAVEYFTSDLPLVEAGYQSSIEKTNHVQSSQRHHHTLLLEAYTLVIRLLPRAASLGMDHAGRLHVLSGAEAISSSAATRAIAAGRDAEVVEILEEGRGVFWSQALRLRTTDLDHLPIQDAQELRRLFQTLDTASVRDESMNKVQREQHIEQRRRLSNVAEALITDIRSRPGMSRFLLPPAFSSLVQSLPAQGFVVLLVASNLGHHALVLNRAKGLTANVELSPPEGGFSSKTVRASLPRDGHTSVDDASASRLLGISGKARRVPKEPLDQTLAQLWTLIVKPVIDVLGLERAAGSDRPRVWWCVTGQPTFLPIHAAGISENGTTESASNYFVSSYIPTLSALSKSRANWISISCNKLTGVLAACKNFSGWTPLDSVEQEIEVTQTCFNDASAQVLHLSSPNTTVQVLREALEGQSAHILHLACHGEQADSPLDSAFLLSDGRLTIQDLMSIRLPNAVLAFLSACQTARGSEHLPDQAVHLAAAMLFCGFRSVVGTMWMMSDDDGPAIAREFYEALFARETLDLDDIAYALDGAITKLRESGAPASRWAAFIHIGG